MTLLANKSVFANRYRIRRHIATGMAEVYEAYDIDADRTIALKLLRIGQYEDELITELFKRETKALHELKHPNIVELLDAGIDSQTGAPYLVLEWVRFDLAFVINRRAFEGWDAFYESTGRPILEALAFSHSRQIAHRDIKLANILVDEAQAPKLADFGIAKLRTDITPGVTVRDFVSVPYVPPERDEECGGFRRDVYGFGVLALRCLVPRELQTYDQVYEALDEVDVPQSVYDVLSDVLSKDPERRPLSGEVLLDRLERVQKPRVSEWLPVVYLTLTGKAREGLRRMWEGKADFELDKLVAEDLQVVGIERYRGSGGPEQFQLVGGRCWYHVKVSAEEHGLVVVNAAPDDEERLEKRRQFAFAPEVRFIVGNPKDSTVASRGVLDFLTAFAANEREAEQKSKQAAEESLLNSWGKILRAKEAIEKKREVPIPFDAVGRDGNRLRLHPLQDVDDSLVGQVRQIRAADVIFARGEIEAVSPDEVVLYLTDDYRPVPARGDLVVDLALSRRALKRQYDALEAVRFDRATRSELRQLLVNPSSAARPELVETDRWFQEIDESKQRAVKAGLGTSDCLVVEGPPGTGKTTFITELVLQTLARNPDTRILLASQTHVALDNALERVRKADAGVRMVRLGRPADSKISGTVTDLLLDSQIPVWRTECLAKGDEFLNSRAENLGVSIDHLFIARRLRDLRQLRESQEERRVALATVKARIKKWHLDRASEPVSVESDSVPHELAEFQSEEAEVTKQLRELEAAEARVVGDLVAREPELEQVASDPANDLVSWEKTFLPESTQSEFLDRLATLRAEWDVRFGYGREFQSALIASAQVVAGTCVGIAGVPGIEAVPFDLCIIDEASKANATEALIPMTLASRWVLVGDERQLPPFIEDELTDRAFLADQEISSDELRLTLFSHLAANLPGDCTESLLVQHRMRQAIGTMISECFYDGRLENGDLRNTQEMLNVFKRPVTWYSTTSLPDRVDRRVNASYSNPCEVRQVVALLRQLDTAAAAAQLRLRVAVLTAYSGQKVDIRRRADSERLPWLDIECNTVDAFQGREAHFAIYSVTRCNPRGELGFLRDLRRLNVALSRAQFGLAIVGDHVFARKVSGENPFARVIEFVESHPDVAALEVLR